MQTQPIHPPYPLGQRAVSSAIRCGMPALLITAVAVIGAIGAQAAEGPAASDADRDPAPVAKLLSDLDVWILPQPKSAAATGSAFDLARCKGIRLAGTADAINGLTKEFCTRLRERSGVTLAATAEPNAKDCITLGLFSSGTPSPDLSAIAASELQGLGEQGYVVHIDSNGITAAATGPVGLHYASQTIAQITADRTALPGVHIRDWPSLEYRGGQYDVSRGQMPTPDTLKRLARILGEAKANVMELYMEDLFKWRSHPDIAQPEAMTPEEARSLFDAAAQSYVEVRPLLQVLGHFDKIGGKPAYRHLMVPVPPGGVAGHPWTTTVDVRKPEAVALVSDLMEEICQTFPGKFVNIDVTEIADYGFTESGTKAEELPALMLGYVLKLRDILAKHGMRLMVAQYAMDSTGHANGIGKMIDQLPKDVAISSYYTAVFVGGWDKDYPRFRQKGFDFFAQSWISSHDRIMPFVGQSMDFSDLTVGRGHSFGAMGSITADWGDSGHYHLPETTWYPFLYHAASCWTGAKLDRNYFNQAFSRQLFGAKGDDIARAIVLVGNINGQPMKTKKATAGADEPPKATDSRCYHELFADPFADSIITEIVDPGQKGRDILQPADEAVAILEAAMKTARCNRDALEGLLFTAKNYQAIAKKLIMREHWLDQSVSRHEAAAELTNVATAYESLREEFKRLWLAECKDAGSFPRYLQDYDKTILPCKKMADDLRDR